MSSLKTPIVMEYRWYPGKGSLERTYCTWVTHSRRIGPRMEMTVEQLLASLRGQSRVSIPKTVSIWVGVASGLHSRSLSLIDRRIHKLR